MLKNSQRSAKFRATRCETTPQIRSKRHCSSKDISACLSNLTRRISVSSPRFVPFRGLFLRVQATVDISSKFKGVIKSVHYKTHDVASVGAPLVDIEVDDSKLQTKPNVRWFSAITYLPQIVVLH